MATVETWKERLVYVADEGYFEMDAEETQGVSVRLFLTPSLLDELEDSVRTQIITATRFPGVKMVAIMPDVHHGYGVPVGCAIVSSHIAFDAGSRAVAAASVPSLRKNS